MVYQHVTYTVKPGTAKAFYDELAESGVVASIHKNPGCLHYEFFYPADGSDERVFLLEHWDSQEALDIHMAQEYRKTQAAIKDKYCVDVQIKHIKEAD